MNQHARQRIEAPIFPRQIQPQPEEIKDKMMSLEEARSIHWPRSYELPLLSRQEYAKCLPRRHRVTGARRHVEWVQGRLFYIPRLEIVAVPHTRNEPAGGFRSVVVATASDRYEVGQQLLLFDVEIETAPIVEVV